MGKKLGLSETKKAQIVILHKEGFTQKKICKKVSCNKTVVHQAIARFKNFGQEKEWKAKKSKPSQ